jgi:hypothetical protein
MFEAMAGVVRRGLPALDEVIVDTRPVEVVD